VLRSTTSWGRDRRRPVGAGWVEDERGADDRALEDDGSPVCLGRAQEIGRERPLFRRAPVGGQPAGAGDGAAVLAEGRAEVPAGVGHAGLRRGLCPASASGPASAATRPSSGPLPVDVGVLMSTTALAEALTTTIDTTIARRTGRADDP
jgi:hypothetical protein